MALGKTVARNIKAIRIKSGMSQKTLSEKTNLTVRYISRLENGAPNITLDVFERLAHGLNCSPHEILASDIPTRQSKKHTDTLDEVIVSLQSLRRYMGEP